MRRIAALPMALVLTLLLSSLAGCTGELSDNSTDTIDDGTDQTNLTPLVVSLSLVQDPPPNDAEVILTATTADGTAPFTYAWNIDAGATLADSGATLAKTLLPGNHTVAVLVTDATGRVGAASRDVTIALPAPPNHAPSVSLAIPNAAYADEVVNWSISATDEDGDVLSLSIDFGDGTSATNAAGTHTYTEAGTYTVTAVATDPDGANDTATATVVVGTDLPPILDVSSHPGTDGDLLVLTVDQPITLDIRARDPESTTLTITTDWGDSSATIDELLPTHRYTEAGNYTISVSARDARNQVSSWSMDVEVGEQLEDTTAYDLYEEQLPEDDPSNELDADGDDVVDAAENATDEDGFDWEDTFEVDENGDPHHDGDNISNWNEKDTEDIGSVADSDDVNGSGRDGSPAVEDDTLLNQTDRTGANETDFETNESGLSDTEEVMDDVFGDTEDELSETEDDEAAESETYERASNVTGAASSQSNWTSDEDGDGTNDSWNERTVRVLWRDRDGDGNPERAILYRATATLSDFDGDGAHERTRIVIEGLNLTDANSNGTPEIVQALRLVVITWDNNSGAQVDTHTSIVVAHVRDHNEDGNPELVYVAHGNIIQIDLGDDGVIEGQHIAYGVNFVVDKNSDGTPNRVLLLRHDVLTLDLDGDGNANQTTQWSRILSARDRDQDGSPDVVRAAQFGGTSWDNNSDGRQDSRDSMWLGASWEDRNLDGQWDRETHAQGYEHLVDADGDGNPERRTHIFAVSQIANYGGQRQNATNAWYVAIAEDSTDHDDDGQWEFKNASAAGARAWDWNRDGVVDRYVAMRAYTVQANESANGTFQYTASHVWLLETWDRNSNGHPDEVHAVTVLSQSWDNNSDGQGDTTIVNAAGWFATIIRAPPGTGGGLWLRQVYVRMDAHHIDDDADGLLEVGWDRSVIHVLETDYNTGELRHAWAFGSQDYRVNETGLNDTWEYRNQTIAGYETWNTTGVNGKQETHARVFSYVQVDANMDGIWDSQTVSQDRDNRA